LLESKDLAEGRSAVFQVVSTNEAVMRPVSFSTLAFSSFRPNGLGPLANCGVRLFDGVVHGIARL
jgi:hypothetical protein